MSLLWPPGWTRGRRGALCVVNGIALWVTALMIHVYLFPAEWNLARSTPSTITELVSATMWSWVRQPAASVPDVFAHFGSFLLAVGILWYGLLRPLVVRHTDLITPISGTDATK